MVALVSVELTGKANEGLERASGHGERAEVTPGMEWLQVRSTAEGHDVRDGRQVVQRQREHGHAHERHHCRAVTERVRQRGWCDQERD